MKNAENRLRSNIRRLIEERAIIKRAFGEAAGRGSSWVTGYLKSEKRFPLDRLDDVAKFFAVTTQELLGDDRATTAATSREQREKLKTDSSREHQSSVLHFHRSLVEPSYRMWHTGPPEWLISRVEAKPGFRPPVQIENMVGERLQDYLPPEKAKQYARFLEIAWEGERVEYYYSVLVDGRLLWRRAVMERDADQIQSSAWEVPARDSGSTFEVGDALESMFADNGIATG